MNNLPIPSHPNAVVSAPTVTGGQSAPVNTASVPATGTSGDGLSIASFVFGLISVIFLPLGMIPGFLGFVLSLDAKRRGSRHSLLTAGRVLSIVGMVAIPALYLLLMIWAIGMSSMLL